MNLKQMAGEKAVEWLEDGMTVGLGTGSTAYWAIKRIGDLVNDGLSVRCVATSVQSEELARECGVNVLDVNDVESVDLTIDGADEVDPGFNLIKGGGGALLREKIVASLSKSEIIVVDASKMVEKLNLAFPLPVEVVPFGWERARSRLEALGCTAERRTKDNGVYKTDNGNFILDCAFGGIADPAGMEAKINNIPGVVENGLFVNLANIIIVASESGLEILQK